MRGYSKVSNILESDASNIAGVLASFPDKEKAEIESRLSQYMSKIPEKDLVKVTAEKVGKLGKDAMLYCEENWNNQNEPTIIDASTMSDGTLRFLAIVATLLVSKEGSLILIEEVDNGLHPSRAEYLIKVLLELGREKKIDSVFTTHNPALLDALGTEMIPFISVVHRNPTTGNSEITLLEDIEQLPKLMASGSIGKLASQGKIEESLKHQNQVK
jgi:predicted ATPase